LNSILPSDGRRLGILGEKSYSHAIAHDFLSVHVSHAGLARAERQNRIRRPGTAHVRKREANSFGAVAELYLFE